MSVAAAAGGAAGAPVAVGNGPGGGGGVGILAGGVGAAVGGGGVWYSVGGGVGPDAAGGGLGGAAVAVLAGSVGRVRFWNEKVGAGTAVGTDGGGGIPAVPAGNGVAVGESVVGGALDPQASITAPAMTAAVNGAAILLTFIIITA